MEDSKKKTLMFVVIIVCIIVAIIIAIINSRGGNGSGTLKGQTTWMKCQKCGAEYEIGLSDYQKYVSANSSIETPTPPTPCEKCNAQAAYRAIKCPKCGTVFGYGAAKGKLPDTCTKCGFSEIEDSRK